MAHSTCNPLLTFCSDRTIILGKSFLCGAAFIKKGKEYRKRQEIIGFFYWLYWAMISFSQRNTQRIQFLNDQFQWVWQTINAASLGKEAIGIDTGILDYLPTIGIFYSAYTLPG